MTACLKGWVTFRPRKPAPLAASTTSARASSREPEPVEVDELIATADPEPGAFPLMHERRTRLTDAAADQAGSNHRLAFGRRRAARSASTAVHMPARLGGHATLPNLTSCDRAARPRRGRLSSTAPAPINGPLLQGSNVRTG